MVEWRGFADELVWVWVRGDGKVSVPRLEKGSCLWLRWGRCRWETSWEVGRSESQSGGVMYEEEDSEMLRVELRETRRVADKLWMGITLLGTREPSLTWQHTYRPPLSRLWDASMSGSGKPNLPQYRALAHALPSRYTSAQITPQLPQFLAQLGLLPPPPFCLMAFISCQFCVVSKYFLFFFF